MSGPIIFTRTENIAKTKQVNVHATTCATFGNLAAGQLLLKSSVITIGASKL